MAVSSKIVAVLTSLIMMLPQTHAFWRLECEGSTGLARLDPLMSFGGIGDHVHSIKGGSAFSATSTGSDLLKSNCTSCGVAEDLSAYWSPAMYFMRDDGTVEVVPEKPPHKSYYLLYSGLTSSGKQQTVEPFPTNFQMIAGDSLNRNSSLPNPDPDPLGPWPDESQTQRAARSIGFNCLHYAAGNDERTLMRNSLPSKEFMDATCTDGIRLELQFPSCWNGQLDSPDHKSHVAYPDGVITGNCPGGFDRRLVSLFYETIVATDQFAGKPGKFVLANGDPTGYGYHGDFIAAWKDGTLAAAINACNQQDSSGDMRACSTFTMSQNSGQCFLQNPFPAAIAQEHVKGPMKGLANNHGIYYGPAPAPHPIPQQQSIANSGDAPAPIPVSSPAAPVPTIALPSISAPLISHSAEPIIGQVYEKIAAALSSVQAPDTKPTSLSLTSSILTTTSTQYSEGGKVALVVVEELIVVQEHVFVTGPGAQKTKKVKGRGWQHGAIHQHGQHMHLHG